MKSTFLGTAAVAVASLALASCGGGGGGGSRPSPTPAPSPAPAPAPAPTPTPTPTSANADLVTLTLDENFTNDGAVGTGRFPTDGSASTSTSAIGAVEIEYDADEGRYIVRGNGLESVFGDADIVAENDVSRTYGRESGSTSEALVLTRPGLFGTEPLRYVAGGIYERAVENGANVDATALAFAYGVETLPGSTPETGGAHYGVALVGTSGLWGYAGAGRMTIDFAVGDFRMTIPVQEIDPDGNVLEFFFEFLAEGQLTSETQFAGQFTLNTFERYAGGLSGRFYGPELQEVGAAFGGNGHSGAAIAGFIVGRESETATGENLSAVNLFSDQTYELTGATSAHYANVAGDAYDRNIPDGGTIFVVNADGATGDLRLTNYLGLDERLASDEGTLDESERFTTYELSSGETVSVYRPGPDNPQLALTYVSFVKVDKVHFVDADLGTRLSTSYIPFGTPTHIRPVIGSATYSGIAIGTATGVDNAYALEGTSSFTVDFETTDLSGTLLFDGTHLYTGELVTIEPLNFVGLLNYDQSDFQAEFSSTWDETMAGFLHGYLFGPNAEEIAATFEGVSATDPLSGNYLEVAGIALARQD